MLRYFTAFSLIFLIRANVLMVGYMVSVAARHEVLFWYASVLLVLIISLSYCRQMCLICAVLDDVTLV